MHQTRQQTTTRIPIPRKGTKYIARSRGSKKNSVSVVTALRDILKIASRASEVKKMIHEKLLKINGKQVKDLHEPIYLFNILSADKNYVLKVNESKKFFFEVASLESERLCKVVNKRLLKEGDIQLNLHDGSNIISNEKVVVGDSVHLDFSSKIKKVSKIEKGKKVFIYRGKYEGKIGTINEIKGSLITLSINNHSASINKKQVIAL